MHAYTTAIIKVDPLASPTPFSYANDGAIHITGDTNYKYRN